MTEPNLPTYMAFVSKPNDETVFDVPEHFFAYTETIHGVAKEMWEIAGAYQWAKAFSIEPISSPSKRYMDLFVYSALDDAWLLTYVYAHKSSLHVSSTRQIPLLEVPVEFREKANAVSIVGGFSPSVVADVIPF